MTIFVMVLVAPGGTVVEDADKTKVSRSEVCVFAADENLEAIKAYATVSTRNSGVFTLKCMSKIIICVCQVWSSCNFEHKTCLHFET